MKIQKAAHKHWEEEMKSLSDTEREALQQIRTARKEMTAAMPAKKEVPKQVHVPQPSKKGEGEKPNVTVLQGEEDLKVTKSDLMRKMHDEGMSVAQIARELKCNYGFVYSVIKRYKETGAPERKKETKSEIMRRMYDEGKTVAQIAKELNANYSFVYGVIKRYKEELELQSRK